jgi:hypothetical protein
MSEHFDLTPFHLSRSPQRPYALFHPQDEQELAELGRFLQADALARRAVEECRAQVKEGGMDGLGMQGGRFYVRQDDASGEPFVSDKGEWLVVLVAVLLPAVTTPIATWMAFAVKPEDMPALVADEDLYADLVLPVLRRVALKRMAGGND